MKKEEILSRLCWHDPRNPNFDEFYIGYDPVEPREEGCTCDNCFYSRDELALALLEAMEIAEDLRNRECTRHQGGDVLPWETKVKPWETLFKPNPKKP